jgi:hypothetical protein
MAADADGAEDATPRNGWQQLKALPPWRRGVALITAVYWVAINVIVGVGQLTESWFVDLLARWVLPVGVIAFCLGIRGIRQIPFVVKGINRRRREQANAGSHEPWPYVSPPSDADVEPDDRN